MTEKKTPGKPGRKALPPEERRAHRIQVPVTPEELESMKAAAEAASLPLATWMRESLLRAAKRSRQ
ncbi:MAG: plasmid mobilization protein [Planctomycetaceae bacterium]